MHAANTATCRALAAPAGTQAAPQQASSTAAGQQQNWFLLAVLMQLNQKKLQMHHNWDTKNWDTKLILSSSTLSRHSGSTAAGQQHRSRPAAELVSSCSTDAIESKEASDAPQLGHQELGHQANTEVIPVKLHTLHRKFEIIYVYAIW
nr:hypothetical protein Iba_chr12cCG19770 [Ipomoea batatas]